MDNTVLVAIIAGFLTLTGTFLTAWLPIRQKNKELEAEKQKLKTQNQILEEKVERVYSTGVAIGYYFNFIETVYKIIDESRYLHLEIYNDSTAVSETREFDSNKVRMEIIIPRSLDGASFNAAEESRDYYNKGDIVRVGHKRNFGVNYSIQDNDSLVIIDMPRPLSAVEKYLRSLEEFRDYIDKATGKLIVKNDTEIYRKRQAAEIENFIQTIKTYIQDNRYAINKVVFRQLT